MLRGESGMGSIDGIRFREICEADFDDIKALHEEFFPVRYEDRFYCNAVRGIGLRGGKLFSSIAVEVDCATEKEEIAGFILAQLFSVDEMEDKDIFSSHKEPKRSCIF